jgi:hypothetical protein
MATHPHDAVYPSERVGAKGITKRELIAMELHRALLTDPTDYESERKPGESCASATARIAVEHTDALIKELSKNE